MNKTLSATEARKQFFMLMKFAATPGASVTVTLEGQPPVIMMSQQEFEGWQETVEIMSDPDLMKAIEEGKADIAAGRVVPWEEVKKQAKKSRRK